MLICVAGFIRILCQIAGLDKLSERPPTPTPTISGWCNNLIRGDLLQIWEIIHHGRLYSIKICEAARCGRQFVSVSCAKKKFSFPCEWVSYVPSNLPSDHVINSLDRNHVVFFFCFVSILQDDDDNISADQGDVPSVRGGVLWCGQHCDPGGGHRWARQVLRRWRRCHWNVSVFYTHNLYRRNLTSDGDTICSTHGWANIKL